MVSHTHIHVTAITNRSFCFPPHLVRTLWGSHDGGLPVEEVVPDGAGAALGGGVATEVLKLLKWNDY